MEAPCKTGGKGKAMSKSRVRTPAFYRQSIRQNVVREVNLGRNKEKAKLNREAVGQV